MRRSSPFGPVAHGCAALLLSFGSLAACKGSIKSSSDLNAPCAPGDPCAAEPPAGNDGASPGPAPGPAPSPAIVETNAGGSEANPKATLENAAALCLTDGVASGAEIWTIECKVVVRKPDGTEVEASGLKDGLTVAWRNPDAATVTCAVANGGMEFRCQGSATTDPTSLRIGFDLTTTDGKTGSAETAVKERSDDEAPGMPSVCSTPWSATVADGGTVTAYAAATVAFGATCTSELRSCNAGVLSGSFTHQGCVVATAAACTQPWGGTLMHGASATAYATASVAFGSNCTSETRSCANGALSGSYAHGSCTVGAPASCSLPWGGSLASGQSVDAFQVSHATSAGACTAAKETRTCTNGSLSGTHPHAACQASTGYRVLPDAAIGFGYSNGQAAGGDINGDGIADVVVGANAANGERGRVYVAFGKTAPVTASIATASLDGTNGFYVEGTDPQDRLGYAVTTGDINGDNFDDLVIGAYYLSPGVSGNASPGACYVVFGKASGWPASLNVSSLNGTNGFAMNGTVTDANGAWCGVAVASGDYNGDGYDDVACGCPRRNTVRGDTFVVFGRAGAWTSGNVDSFANGTQGAVVRGVNTTNVAGYALSSGDVNDDGKDDLLIGAYNTAFGASSAGSTYVVMGRAAWGGDASGAAGAYSLASLGGTHKMYRIDGSSASQYTGFTVASGDVNGDNYDDVVIGSLGTERTFVVFGGADAGWNAWASGVKSVTALDGTIGFQLDGSAQNHDVGQSPNGVGDINGDGFADIVLSAAANRGYVVFGKASGWAASVDVTTPVAGSVLAIDSSVNGGVGAAYVADVNDDGFGDVVYGGAERTVVLYGSSTGWAGASVDADLASPQATSIDGVVSDNLILLLDASRGNGTSFPGAGCGTTTFRNLAPAGVYNGALNGFASCGAQLGWVGAGSAADPYALRFDGTTSAAVEIGSLGGQMTLPITLEFWIKPDVANPSGLFDSAPSQPNVLRNRTAGSVEWWSNTPSRALGLAANAWTHLVIIYRHDGANRVIDWYKNGVAQTSASAVAASTFAWTTLELGTVNNGTEGKFDGSLARMGAYTGKALTAGEVAANCNALKARFTGASCP